MTDPLPNLTGHLRQLLPEVLPGYTWRVTTDEVEQLAPAVALRVARRFEDTWLGISVLADREALANDDVPEWVEWLSTRLVDGLVRHTYALN